MKKAARGAKERGEHCQAAGAIAQDLRKLVDPQTNQVKNNDPGNNG